MQITTASKTRADLELQESKGFLLSTIKQDGQNRGTNAF